MGKISQSGTAAWIKAVNTLLGLISKKGNNDGDNGDDPDDRELVREFDPARADGGQSRTYGTKEGLEEDPEGGLQKGPGAGPEDGPEPNDYTTSAQDETFEEMIARAKAIPDNIIEGEDRIRDREDKDLER